MELETDAKSLSTALYVCAIKARHSYFVSWKTVGHILGETSCYIYFLIKEKNGNAFGTLTSLKYKASPIPWRIRTLSEKKGVHDTMEEFIQNFYTFEYSGNESVDTSDSEDEEEKWLSSYRSWTRKRRRWGEGKKSIRQNLFRNRQGRTCSYYNRLIHSIFIVLFFKK